MRFKEASDFVIGKWNRRSKSRWCSGEHLWKCRGESLSFPINVFHFAGSSGCAANIRFWISQYVWPISSRKNKYNGETKTVRTYLNAVMLMRTSLLIAPSIFFFAFFVIKTSFPLHLKMLHTSTFLLPCFAPFLSNLSRVLVEGSIQSMITKSHFWSWREAEMQYPIFCRQVTASSAHHMHWIHVISLLSVCK